MSKWYLVRLELAMTDKFPAGSPLRSYLICLPLEADGVIDEMACKAEPARASVRRFWPNETDKSGYVFRTSHGWAFSYAHGEDEGKNFTILENQPIRAQEYVKLTGPDGMCREFHVAAIEPIRKA